MAIYSLTSYSMSSYPVPRIIENVVPSLERRSWMDLLGDIVKIVIIAAALIVPIRLFLVQPFFVKGSSMEPTLKENDYLLVDELSYRFRQPERGEVVVFRYAQEDKKYFIKRVIGVPGETVDIHDNTITIVNKEHPDGFVLNEPYLPDYNLPDVAHAILGQNEYYVLGDNRPVSYDSKRFGPVNIDHIVGRAVFRGFPLQKATIIHTPTY